MRVYLFEVKPIATFIILCWYLMSFAKVEKWLDSMSVHPNHIVGQTIIMNRLHINILVAFQFFTKQEFIRKKRKKKRRKIEE